jgi:hypothetical protein
MWFNALECTIKWVQKTRGTEAEWEASVSDDENLYRDNINTA